MSRPSERARQASPARFAEPRMLFILLAFALTAFGLLMIYSSSSIMALTSEATGYNPAYYLIRQLIFAGMGVVLACAVAFFDYHVWTRTLRVPITAATIFLLAIVFSPVAGQDAYGATRWIGIGGFSLQPSEFAKIAIIMAASDLAQRYYEERSLESNAFMLRIFLYVVLPLALILVQPDKGTVMVVGITLVLMLFLAGAPWPVVGGLVALGFLGMLFLGFHDSYSRARMLTMLDPWQDPYGDGYQLIQGFYAFGSGGLFGVGLGNSRQKYSYLPMAHNDFVFAVIGEELGLVGTLAVLLAFAALVWLGYRIAREAPDLSGRLLAAGSVSLLAVQLLLNVSGVLGVFPLSGKPVPFISYGGSSIMSCLVLVGMVVSVSRSSSLPTTVYDERRAGFHLSGEAVSGSRLRVIRGGATPDDLRASRDLASAHAGSRISVNANGTRRIDLGPSASDRLRGRGGTSRGGRG